MKAEGVSPPAPSVRAEARAAAVVCGWLRGQLDGAQRSKVLVMEAERPESRLLHGWLTEAGIAWHPAPSGPRSLAHALADAELQSPEFFPVVSHHKSRLLLDGAPNAALPLGDLWATDVLEWIGACTLPVGVRDVAQLLQIEGALRQGLQEDRLRRALGSLAEVDSVALEARLRRVAASLQGPRIPKLQALTIGMDLRLT